MGDHQLLPASQARADAAARQLWECLACLLPLGAVFDAHHRQSRNVLGWCMCNVVALHPRCHTQGPTAVHDQPALARELGLIVPSWADPRTVPVRRLLLGCDGSVSDDLPE